MSEFACGKGRRCPVLCQYSRTDYFTNRWLRGGVSLNLQATWEQSGSGPKFCWDPREAEALDFGGDQKGFQPRAFCP